MDGKRDQMAKTIKPVIIWNFMTRILVSSHSQTVTLRMSYRISPVHPRGVMDCITSHLGRKLTRINIVRACRTLWSWINSVKNFPPCFFEHMFFPLPDWLLQELYTAAPWQSIGAKDYQGQIAFIMQKIDAVMCRGIFLLIHFGMGPRWLSTGGKKMWESTGISLFTGHKK